VAKENRAEMKRVVVSGATGFVGRAVVSALVARGDSVVALTRSPDRARRRLPEPVELVAWDTVRDEGALDCVDGADAVVNLLGEQAVGQRWTAKVKREIKESRVRGTTLLAEAIQRAAKQPAVLVSASGVGHYGDRGAEPVDESAGAGTDFLARVTVEWERAARLAVSDSVRVVLLRLGIVLGKGGGALTEMVKPFKLFVGGPIGSGEQGVSWVHLADVVGIVLRALDDVALRGPVNVASPNAVSNAQLARELGRVLRRPAAIAVPEFALRLRFGEGADPLVIGQRAVPRVLERAGYRFSYPELRPALEEALG
jgi:uncharacterized protein (TIGR01777 family)